MPNFEIDKVKIKYQENSLILTHGGLIAEGDYQCSVSVPLAASCRLSLFKCAISYLLSELQRQVEGEEERTRQNIRRAENEEKAELGRAKHAVNLINGLKRK